MKYLLSLIMLLTVAANAQLLDPKNIPSTFRESAIGAINTLDTRVDTLETNAFDPANVLVPIQTINKTGTDNSDNLYLYSGSVEDGNGGNVEITAQAATGSGTGGGVRLEGQYISLVGYGQVTEYAGTNFSFASDGGLSLIPGNVTTPPLKLYEGTGNLFAQLKATDDGGLDILAEGFHAQLGLATGLLDSYWGGDIPAMIFDSTAAVADAEGATGIVLKGNDAAFVIATQDMTDASATSDINIVTGINAGTGGSGGWNRGTGDTTTATSGSINDTTGSNPGGGSGSYSFSAGSSSTAENQGDYSVSAGQLLFTSADANGIIFQQTGSGDITFLANTGQINLAVKDGDSVNIKSNDATDEPELKIFDADNSASIAIKAPETLANSYELVGPTAPFAGAQYLASQTLPTTYTPTLSHTSGITSSVFKWHREGHWLVISGQILYTSAGDAADFTFSLPGAAAGSPAIETSELVGGTGVGNDTSTTLGHGIWFDSGVGWKALWPRYASTTTVGFFTVNQKWWNSLAASGDSLNFTVRLPIAGW